MSDEQATSKWSLYQRKDDLTAEVPGMSDIAQALDELVTDDDPIIVGKEGVPRLVVIDWFQYELMIDNLRRMDRASHD